MHHHAKGASGGDAGSSQEALPTARKRGSETSTAKSPTSQDSAKSWRDVLPVHPAANMFPPLSEAELKELGDDIKQNGLRETPAITTSKTLLDGRSRLDAMEAAGISFEFVFDLPEWAFIGWGENNLHDARPLTIVPDSDAYAYVVSANIHRRHLTGEQKRDLIANLLKVTPEKSNRQIAETVKADHKTVASVRAEKEATGEIPQLPKTVGRDRKARSSKWKRPPSAEDFQRQMAAKKAAVAKPPPTEGTEREVVAPDEEIALLREFARFVVERATAVRVEPKDHAEWKVLLGRVKQVLGAMP
jgi:hypothetical protein